VTLYVSDTNSIKNAVKARGIFSKLERYQIRMQNEGSFLIGVVITIKIGDNQYFMYIEGKS